jgi:urease accessory protein
MIIVRAFAGDEQPHCDELLKVELPYDLRKKSRVRAVTTCGREVGIQLQRGSELRHGQRLLGDSGELIEISASPETLSSVTSGDALLLMKAAYHLGNRHVPLQVTEHCLRYQHDHVLDDMVLGLGLEVAVVEAPFQPESGAYHRHGGGHGHSHEHGHEHHHHEH